jgi:hypothetical protein
MVHAPEKRGLSSEADPVNVSRDQRSSGPRCLVRPWWFVVGLMDEVCCESFEPAPPHVENLQPCHGGWGCKLL